MSRGPAPANLDFTHETAEASQRFRPEQLPSARFLDLEQAGLIGLGRRDPEVAPTAESATGAEVGAGSGSSWRRRLAPRHRRAVQRFFDTEER